MNSLELKLLREFLFLDVETSAKLIGDCSNRTWWRWEAGESKISKEVAEKMEALKAERAKILELAEKGKLKSFKIKNDIDKCLVISVNAEMLAKNK